METACINCGAPVELTRSKYRFNEYWGVCKRCGKYNWRRLYKCRDCDGLTLHKYVETRGTVAKAKEVYVCEVCGREKVVYTGFRKSPERSMMSGG